MHRRLIAGFFAALACLLLTGCGEEATLPVSAGMGPNPELPPPVETALPTVVIAEATGWPDGKSPEAADGLAVNAFAANLDHPRMLYVLPNGDVLAAESAAPPQPGMTDGIMGHLMKLGMWWAGAGVESPNRITLLRDGDGDGVAETRTTFLSGLNSPYGMALVGDSFYVANTDGIVRFPYRSGDTEITAKGEAIADLPAGPVNIHWVKNIVAHPDGTKLYASVGSNSNVGERGFDSEEGRAAIHEIDLESGSSRLFASGLRNPVGLAFHPDSGKLWTSVNERDELGSDLVPDYMTSVQENGFYGWPYSYFGDHIDARVQPQRPDLVKTAIVPDYALGPHTASLGLAFYTGDLFPERYRGGAFIGQHGSWNRRPPSGYKVIFVPFEAGTPSGEPEDILTGFLGTDGKAYGRPVGVAEDRTGALLVADDVGNTVWRVAPATQ
ncbi:PQQ-dependent sugar dehydrogenase [Methyloceanibacter caenitepidi]|uniref:L-sorbosone dehydrogenase n=1 Tax=Methyloceanibacter caenitepidi TaxID=1384459 RepID=A0A0A8K1R7_9HYPH|nr:sorbosone dehydrogenase family protein [Methyloceanibacter caenitepidi]BAQ16878.1 L-sorbosone dehydrogenase [Methyloceanibacter caenitepidi]